MGMTIKKIKQLFCFHDYQFIGQTCGHCSLLKEYYSCTKCGKIMCVTWKWEDNGNDD